MMAINLDDYIPLYTAWWMTLRVTAHGQGHQCRLCQACVAGENATVHANT